MASNDSDAGDVHALMEALWGPRRDSGAGPATGHAADEPVAAPAPPVEANHPTSGRVDVSDLRQELDVLRTELAAVELRLTERVADLAAKTPAPADVTSAVPEGDLASVRAELARMESLMEAALADRSQRQDDLDAEVKLLEKWERESEGRLATLEHAVGAEVERISSAVAAAAEAQRVAAADVETLRSELGAALATVDHSQLRADLEFQMVEQLRQVLQEVLAAVDARMTAMGAELSTRVDGSVSKEDFAALRSELKQALSANMASAQAALQQRVADIDATLADVKSQVGRRLEELAALVVTEAAAAAERATLHVLPWRSPGT